MSTRTFKPGDPVVTLRRFSHRNRYSIEESTVDRITAKQGTIVLADGQRFGPSLVRRTGTWDPPTHLHHPDDPEVREARLTNRRGNRVRKIEDYALEFRRHPNHATAELLIENLKAYLEIPEEDKR